jgi:hypothetical protein
MIEAAGGDRSRLFRALALSRRFHLYLVRCASPRAADGLLDELPDALARRGRTGGRLARLSPYEQRRGDAPLTDAELADRVLVPLLDPPPEVHDAIHVVDASRAAHADLDAWGRFFSLWNEKRNLLRPSHGEVLVMLPAVLAPVFATAAPDVWSIRSGEYVIDEGTQARIPGLEGRAQGTVTGPISSVQIQLRGTATARAIASGRLSVPVDTAWLTETVLRLVRAVPPLALFGGDLLVRPWVEDVRAAREAGELLVEERGLSGAAPALLVQRRLRLADSAVAAGRFDEAEALFSELSELAGDHDDSAEGLIVALSGLAVALVGQDRAAEAAVHGERALSLLSCTRPLEAEARVGRWRGRAVRAVALVQWCLGHLDRAARLASSVSGRNPLRHEEEAVSKILQLAERGLLDEAKSTAFEPQQRLAAVYRGQEVLIARLIAMDLAFLKGDLDTALFDLEGGARMDDVDSISPWEDEHEHAALLRRRDTAVSLIELARGNGARAKLVLAREWRWPAWRPALEPAASFRADAFHAVASGILEIVTGNLESASTRLSCALDFIAEWGRFGLDRRSRLRARLFVELITAALEAEGQRALSAARALAAQAESLLGDTGEDCVSRVLAVEAQIELARRLAATGRDDARVAAHRAMALSRPLGGLGVPAWDALRETAELQLAASQRP